MKKTELTRLFRLFAVPVVLIAVGAILVLAPDSAAILAARMISFLLTATGIGYSIAAFLGRPGRRGMRLFTAVFCLILGSVLLANPLILAANIGRALGILLAFEGIQNLTRHSAGKPMALLTLLGSIILILAPMTASRLVFTLCGLLLVVIGIAQLLERNRRRRLRKGSGDPNIIDAPE